MTVHICAVVPVVGFALPWEAEADHSPLRGVTQKWVIQWHHHNCKSARSKGLSHLPGVSHWEGFDGEFFEVPSAGFYDAIILISNQKALPVFKVQKWPLIGEKCCLNSTEVSTPNCPKWSSTWPTHPTTQISVKAPYCWQQFDQCSTIRASLWPHKYHNPQIQGRGGLWEHFCISRYWSECPLSKTEIPNSP